MQSPEPLGKTPSNLGVCMRFGQLHTRLYSIYDVLLRILKLLIVFVYP